MENLNKNKNLSKEYEEMKFIKSSMHSPFKGSFIIYLSEDGSTVYKEIIKQIDTKEFFAACS